MRLLPGLYLILFPPALVTGIAIDNGVIGDPQISCGSSFLEMKFHTLNPFGGHVYVKGRFSEASCRIDGDSSINNEASIAVAFDSCGVRRSRSVNPKGLLMTVTLLIMFHARFMTKVDRAYYVQCFYMEAEKTVTAGLDVSMITTSSLLAQAPMPTCRYSVLDNKAGQPIRYAKVGDPVHHRWTCDATVADVYCMIVHTCTVDDGSGNTVTLIDANGCAQDQYLLGNLEYYDDLTVGRDAHVFKYADKSTVAFNCQISVAPRQGLCPRPLCPLLDESSPSVSLQPPSTPGYAYSSATNIQTHPTSTLLPAPPAWIDRKIRSKRSSNLHHPHFYGTTRAPYDETFNESSSTIDVDSHPILVFDLDSHLDPTKLNRMLTEKQQSQSSWKGFCLSRPLFSLYALTSAAMVLISCSILFAITCHRCRRSAHKLHVQQSIPNQPDDLEGKAIQSRYQRFFALRLPRQS